MSLLKKVFVLCLLSPLIASETFNDLYNRVNVHLRQQFQQTSAKAVKSNDETLQNSNKIGLGYNLLYGNPVCYTGTCQMEGFAQPVFKLSYTQKPQGLCTTKLIPQYVNMDCLPSVEVEAGTEIINTLQQLQESTMNGIEISASAKYKLASASYKYSSQTRYMIDNIIKSNNEVLYTTAKISTIKLSMFEPLMDLSDEFRYVIDNLPCCNYSEVEVDKYIYDFVFNYYGFAFVNQLLLGGIAQQNLFISKSELATIEKKGYEKSQEAKAEFFGSLGIKQSASFDQTKHNEFMKYVKKTYATALGGDSSIKTFEEWSKTVPANPIVIKFGVKYLFDLISEKRFPSDKNIIQKRNLIEKALDKYIQNPLYCYNSCSGNGICQPSSYFQFGLCKCNEKWTGVDCSTAVPNAKIPWGTLCGLKDAIQCEGITPDSGCPSGWQKINTDVNGNGLGAICCKLNEGSGFSKRGTICGISYGSLVVKCDGRDPNSDGCPVGYQMLERIYSNKGRICHKTDDSRNDASGTLCGLLYKANGVIRGKMGCDGFDLERGGCPPGYTINYGQEDIGERTSLTVCSKD